MKENYEAIEDHPGYIIKNEKAKWEIEAKEAFVTDKNSPEECIWWGPYLNGYIEARHKKQEEISTLQQKLEKIEKSLVIKILENAKGIQVLSNIIEENTQLREGIEKHKWEKWGYGEDSKEGRFYEIEDEEDEELYDLIKEKGR